MTMAISARQRNGSLDCGGAQVRAHCRHLATVVTVGGEVDAVNVERVADCLRHFIVGDNPVVLDISGTEHFAGAGLSLLSTFDEECRRAGVQWTLVAGPDVIAQLTDGDGECVFPAAGSVPEAFADLADAVVFRRRLALPLIRKSA
ncbi:STAS domain-containing protein [Mycobacterium sherrisii]|uniref:Sulfate transporter n=1 Tax=Mycobacterium sherrisii TaxID=243061 RepID=A0A1E3T1I2_9MYCO|nr:STAS domain-containing protein [Mycobacterium sherrisii]MCV7029352.1 STAS domain-containing protein [Mycobacterium sherrisii]MEC4765536.1 STAS domain-containing protein [Mycobacterium sherrisii]ODR08230.1 sulfate transporter [Mycobacterium sherrisii]ORW73407.1 sulfate transporter [Mycobacterium sherrisii]